MTGKKSNLFIAKFDWHFLQDENGPLAAIDCFLEEHKRNKNDTIVTSNLICGPLTCSFNECGKWLDEQYCDVKKFFDVAKHLNRKQTFNKFICKKFDTGNWMWEGI